MVVVTHRIASVRNCDRILHLEEGSMRALGSFEAVCGSLPNTEAPPRDIAVG